MSATLTRRIARIKQKIVDLGAVHPGRITRQYNVCGTPGCRCKDPEHPRKHGPYHNLSYTFRGQSKTLFVRRECAAEMKRRTGRYVQLKKLFEELVDASVQLARKEVFERHEKT